MKKEITLSDIAGYATEKTVWRLIRSLVGYGNNKSLGRLSHDDIAVRGNAFEMTTEGEYEKRYAHKSPAGCHMAFAAPETFRVNASDFDKASNVWSIGAVAFYAIMGTDVFEGKGGETQTTVTPIPVISSTHASTSLSDLIRRSLSCLPTERPTLEEMRQQADKALAEPVAPRRRLTNHSGKSYAVSLIKFWPEEMATMIFLCLLSFVPVSAIAQNTSFPLTDEMRSLVSRCVDLRSRGNIDKVTKAMQEDLQWTMMDELMTSDNTRKTADKVLQFGMNDIALQLLWKRRGVANAGGNFRDGRDKRFRYSLIEITIKSGGTVNYQFEERQGEQVLAVVPYEKDERYSAYVTYKQKKSDEIFIKDGVSYLHLKRGLKKGETFMLTLKNESGRNASFILINYNSQNNE